SIQEGLPPPPIGDERPDLPTPAIMRSRWASAVLIAGSVTVVVAGYPAGHFLDFGSCSLLTAIASALGFILALMALCRPRATAAERVSGAALMGYVILAAATEQFAF